MASQNYLQWTDENQTTRRVEIVDRIFIGRDCIGIDKLKCILVDSRKVSRDHAVIKLEGSRLQITDMSKNGTWVNDVRIAAGSSQDLEDGDVIQVPELSVRVFCNAPASIDEKNDRLIPESTVVDSTKMEVTNVVADVRGFAGISQIEDSSSVYALMKKIFGTFTPIVRDFKGTVKDHAGDAVFAYWDHHVAPGKERAVLACRAAIKQAKALDDIRTQLSGTNLAVEHLQMGWGITTGTVTMSHYGENVSDMALVGDCINLAFRFSGIANKEVSDEIVVCSQTADLVRHVIPVVDLGLSTIRGRRGTVHIFGVRTWE